MKPVLNRSCYFPIWSSQKEEERRRKNSKVFRNCRKKQYNDVVLTNPQNNHKSIAVFFQLAMIARLRATSKLCLSRTNNITKSNIKANQKLSVKWFIEESWV